MDAFVLIAVGVFSLIFILLGYLGQSQKNKASWALFPFFGSLLESYNALALLADGNLTSGGTTLASANGTVVSDFYAVSLIPIMLAGTAGIIAIKKAFNI
jgi:hypothetical protein